MAEYLTLCLDSVHNAIHGMQAEVIVVDNASDDESLRIIKEKFPQVLLIANEKNVGFSKANNQAYLIAKGKYIHYLNPDTIIPEDYYQKHLEFMANNPDAGAVGPRLIDGKGKYAMDAKKAFPSFWVSVSKVLGFSKLFPSSPIFNRYYAANVGEFETAVVDIISGCCMFIRRDAIELAGGPFDEQYFMYCEDVDLCHRINQTKYQNYYFPETDVLHFKGESTRKLTFSYMKIFYEAHAKFVKKYYPARLGILYNTALKSILVCRNVFSVFKYIFASFKIFLLDIIILSASLYFFAKYWFSEIAKFDSAQFDSILFIDTIPVYIIIWMLMLFLNGAYDKPYSLFRTGRGMVMGTLVVLAIYGLMPIDYRFSRGVMVFSGMTSTLVMILARTVFAFLGIIKLVPRGKNEYKAVVIGQGEKFEQAKQLLLKRHYPLEVVGNVSTDQRNLLPTAIGTLNQLPALQQIFGISECVFINKSISYKALLAAMQTKVNKVNYKFLSLEDVWLLGSNTDNQYFQESAFQHKYNIITNQQKRNKRLLDIIIAVLLLIISPVYYLWVPDSRSIFINIKDVLLGNKTWVSYRQVIGLQNALPVIKQGILLPFNMSNMLDIADINIDYLLYKYAKDYSYLDDVTIIWKNLKLLGKKQ